MLEPAIIDQLAQRLHDAERERKQIRQISLDHPDITIDDAYAIQRTWVALKLAEGRTLKGHKIGLTSKAMQNTSQIDGFRLRRAARRHVLRRRRHDSHRPLHRAARRGRAAFVLGKRLTGPDCTIFDVYDAVDYVVPALEIIDARSQSIDPDTKRPRKVFDTIADNAANAGVVIGGRPVKPQDVDLRWVAAIMSRNGVVEETGVAAGVLNHPANGVAWLANRLARFDVALEPGQIVLGGSFTRPARPGDTFSVDYGPLGTIQCYFE